MGTRCPAPWTRTYVQLRSWCTTPAALPSLSTQGVDGRRVKPWTPPNVVFCEPISVMRVCQASVALTWMTTGNGR